MVEEESKSNGIQSIEVGMYILKKISEVGKPLSITEISIVCDTSKSKLHRYLTSFVRTGILEKTQDTKYILGPELLRLGLIAQRKLSITEIASPHLMYLKETLNETIALAVLGQNGPFFISWEESNGPVNIGIKVGSEVSVTQSSAGLVFAAFLSSERIDEKIQQELVQSSLSFDQFQGKVDFCKTNGYAYVKGTTIPGISGIAAPIFDQSSKLVASLTVVGLEQSLDISENAKPVLLLKERAAMISKLLGWNGSFFK